MVDWLFGGIALSGLFAALNISLLVFFKTGSYAREFEEKNRKVLSRLLQEFRKHVDSWVKDIGNVDEERKYFGEVPKLQRIAGIGGLVEKWNGHMSKGKSMLRKSAGAIFGAGISFSVGFAILAAEVPELAPYVPVVFFLTFLFVVAGFSLMRRYIDLTGMIETKYEELRMGKDLIEDKDLSG